MLKKQMGFEAPFIETQLGPYLRGPFLLAGRLGSELEICFSRITRKIP
jgi:hypothetical protein